MTTQPETPVVERVSRIEGVVEQINLRLAENHDDIQALRAESHAEFQALRAESRAEFQALNAKIDAQGEALNAKIDAQGEALRAEMNARFNTVYVLVGGVWATMVGGFIALFLAIPVNG